MEWGAGVGELDFPAEGVPLERVLIVQWGHDLGGSSPVEEESCFPSHAPTPFSTQRLLHILHAVTQLRALRLLAC